MNTDYNSLGDSIQKLTQLTEENNRILKAMRREKWIGMIVNIVFWGGAFYLSYVLTAQFLGPLMGNSGDLNKILEQYQAQLGK